MTPAEACSLAGRYAKPYAAGAFAFPTRKELEANPDQLWTEEGFAAVTKRLSRDSVRTHFTGQKFVLQAGKSIVTHIARDPKAELPPIGGDYVTAYLDDRHLCAWLELEGYVLMGATISASSEMKGIFWHGDPVEYPAYDLATVTPIPLQPSDEVKAEIFREVQGLTGYRDDWPLYSDGSWGALCLKGYYPEDPGRDMKPLEMNKKWQAEHPEDLSRTCEWTKLAADCPAIMEWITSVPWWGDMERVRLLQMSGRNGKGGSLGRHTDIGDKQFGTDDGKIVRFHMPIVTDPAIELHTWDLTGVKISTHLRSFHTYYLDARKPHAVTNPTGVDRVHLVVDVVSSPEVREQISTSYLL